LKKRTGAKGVRFNHMKRKKKRNLKNPGGSRPGQGKALTKAKNTRAF